MFVSLDFLQSGSATTKISAQPGDVITFELNSTVYNNVVGGIVSSLNGLTTICGVSFALNSAGTAVTVLNIAQSGSASTAISAASGDTVTLELAETVYSNILQSAVSAYLARLTGLTGVIFAANVSGGAT
jgi:hypothetical protein